MAIGVALAFGLNKRNKDRIAQSKAVVEWGILDIPAGRTDTLYNCLPPEVVHEPEGFGTEDRLRAIASERDTMVAVVSVHLNNDLWDFPEGPEGFARQGSRDWNALQLVDARGKTHYAFFSRIVQGQIDGSSINFHPVGNIEDFIKANVWFLIARDVPIDGLKFRFKKQSFSQLGQAPKVDIFAIADK